MANVDTDVGFSYLGTCEVYLPRDPTRQEHHLGAEGDERQRGRPFELCYTSSRRFVCMNVSGSLLELDLQTTTCVCNLEISESLLSMCYLNQQNKKIVGLTESGFIKVYDLAKGQVFELAFALKKNQQENFSSSTVKLAAASSSSSHPGIFWSVGKSNSVYWMSLKHAREVRQKKKHVPNIEDAFRIKSDVKSPVVAIATSQASPLLVVARSVGVVEVYNTDTFKLVRQVQLALQVLLDMEVAQLGSSLSIGCIGVSGSTINVHHVECVFSDEAFVHLTKVVPRDPLCSISGSLASRNSQLIHMVDDELGIVNQGAGVIVQVATGERRAAFMQKVTRLEALKAVKRDGLGASMLQPSDRENLPSFLGLSPQLKSVFVCTKFTEEDCFRLQVDVYRDVCKLKQSCQRNHGACLTHSVKAANYEQEDTLDDLEADSLALDDRVEKFKLTFDSSSQCIEIELTEIAMDRNASKVSHRTQYKLSGSFSMSNIDVTQVSKRFIANGDMKIPCWILQCSESLVLLVVKQSGENKLAVEHFFGNSCGFVELQGNDEDIPDEQNAYFCIANQNQLYLHKKEVSEMENSLPAATCLSVFALPPTADHLRLLHCAFTSPNSRSSLKCIWSTDRAVSCGETKDDCEFVEVKSDWHLEAEHEIFLDSAHVHLNLVNDAGCPSLVRLALLTSRRLLLMDETLSIAKQLHPQDNDGKAISLHWLGGSERLICITERKVLQLGKWDDYTSFRSLLSLDTSNDYNGSKPENLKGIASLKRNEIFYFEHPMQGLEDKNVLSYTLPLMCQKQRPAAEKGHDRNGITEDLIRRLDPRIKVLNSKINVSITGTNLHCHVNVDSNGEDDFLPKYLSLLMTNPEQVDLRYNSDPAKKVCGEEKKLIRAVLNVIAFSEDQTIIQKLFTEEKDAAQVVSAENRETIESFEFAGITSALSQASTMTNKNPYFTEFETSSGSESKAPSQGAVSPQDVFSSGAITQSPAPSLLDSYEATPVAAQTPDTSQVDSPPSLPSSSSKPGGATWSDSDKDSDSDSDEASSFFGSSGSNKKKIMISIKPVGSSANSSAASGNGSSSVLKSAIANLSLESPPLMSLQTPSQEQSQRLEVPGSLESPAPLFQTPEIGTQGNNDAVRQMEEEETSAFSPDSSDDEASGYKQKKFNIRIKPASEASTTASASNTSDIRNMLSTLRSSIEGPLTGSKVASDNVAQSQARFSSEKAPSSSNSSPRGVAAASEGNSAQDNFQEGMRLLNSRQWSPAIVKLDEALHAMAKDFEKLKKYWYVVVHHRVYAGIMQKCDTLNDQPDHRVHRNLMLCARRLRLQSILGIQVTISTAQSLIRTKEYKSAHALLDAMLKVLPRYPNMAPMTPKVTQMRDLCMAKLEDGVNTLENPYLGEIATHLAQVQSVQQLDLVMENVFAQACSAD